MPIAHGPVLSLDLLRTLKRPIHGRRSAPTRPGAGRSSWAAGRCWRRWRCGLAVWLGELPNSFVKRRLGIGPGTHRRTPAGYLLSLYDQADWVPVAALMLRPVWRMRAREIAQVFAVVAAVHLPVNVVGYAVGAHSSRL